jgi:hypothetical protein
LRRAENSNPTVLPAIRVRNGACGPGRFTLHVSSPARCEQARDGRGRSARCPRCYPPPGFRPGPAPWPVHPPRRVGDSNTTALAAQSLAATPDP